MRLERGVGTAMEVIQTGAPLLAIPGGVLFA
jgi:hypothetical protein